MASVVFVHDKSKDPMYPGQVAVLIANSLSLNNAPRVDVDFNNITVTHPQVTEANRTAIQGILDAYVYDDTFPRTSDPQQDLILSRLKTYVQNNNTFLAISGNPSSAQQIAELRNLARMANIFAKYIFNDLTDASNT